MKQRGDVVSEDRGKMEYTNNWTHGRVYKTTGTGVMNEQLAIVALKIYIACYLRRDKGI